MGEEEVAGRGGVTVEGRAATGSVGEGRHDVRRRSPNSFRRVGLAAGREKDASERRVGLGAGWENDAGGSRARQCWSEEMWTNMRRVKLIKRWKHDQRIKVK
jgi:hypothetical protein